MKFQKAITYAQSRSNSLLESELLLAKVSKKPRTYILAHPEKKLNLFQKAHFLYLLRARSKNKPMAYILEEKEFFGLKFKVSKDVLIPRPDTEILVERAIELMKEKSNPQILEIGTGSGCIACSLARNLADSKIIATDISKKALKVAETNIKKLALENQVKLELANLCPSKIKKADLVVANLPYIRSSDYKKLPSAIRDFEPQKALVAGRDGLDFYRPLINQIASITPLLLIEIADQKQVEDIQRIFSELQYKVLKDLSGASRVLEIRF